MISQKDMLNIIATEAIEYGGVPESLRGRHRQLHSSIPEPVKDEGPTMHMPLRLVREPDGSLHWED